jgi:hypothetical protein
MRWPRMGEQREGRPARGKVVLTTADFFRRNWWKIRSLQSPTALAWVKGQLTEYTRRGGSEGALSSGRLRFVDHNWTKTPLRKLCITDFPNKHSIICAQTLNASRPKSGKSSEFKVLSTSILLRTLTESADFRKIQSFKFARPHPGNRLNEIVA